MEAWLFICYRQSFFALLIISLAVSCPPSSRQEKSYPTPADIVNAWGSLQSSRIRTFARKEQVVLDCAVESPYDGSRALWMRNHVPLDLHSHRARILHNGTLIFASINFADQGIYQCIAPSETFRDYVENNQHKFNTNNYPGMQYILKDGTIKGTTNSSEDWYVTQPSFEIPFHPEQTFPLYCRNYEEFPLSSLHPHRTVFWIKNDTALTSDDQIRFLQLYENDMLVLWDTREEDDYAVFQCIAVYHHDPSDPETPNREHFALVKASYRYQIRYFDSVRMVQNWDYYRNTPSEPAAS